MAANTAINEVNSSTRPSTPISSARGNVRGTAATAARVPQAASSSPKPPPAIASPRLSVRSCRIRRPWPAPERCANRKLPAACLERASSKLATLTHAISNTNATAPSRTSNTGRTSPTICSRIGTIFALMFASTSGYAAARPRFTRAKSCAAAIKASSGLEARDGVHSPCRAAIAELRFTPLAKGSVCVRRPEVPHLQVKVAGNDADDCAAFPIEDDPLPHNSWIRAEFPPPQPFGDHCRRVRAQPILFRVKRSPRYRPYAQNFKKTGRNHCTGNTLRLARPGQRESTCAAIGRHGLEGLVLSLPIEKVGVGDRSFREVRLVVEKVDDTVGFRIRKRVQQNAIHHGKNRGIRANSQG